MAIERLIRLKTTEMLFSEKQQEMFPSKFILSTSTAKSIYVSEEFGFMWP